MAKYHYNIVSKKRLKWEEDNNGNLTLTCKSVESIKENKSEIYNNNIKKGKSDPVIKVLTMSAIACILSLLIVLVIGKGFFDMNEGLYYLIDDIIASGGFLLMIYSLDVPYNLIKKLMYRNGEWVNRAYVSIITFALMIALSFILTKFGINGKSANLLSLLCIFVAIMKLE